MIRPLLLVFVWLAPLLALGGAALLSWLAARRRRTQMETDAQWWEQFQKRVSGS